MSEAMDAMLKIGITEPESEIRTVLRQPNSVSLWPARELPKGRRRTDLPFTSVAGRRQHSIILKNRQRFFCRCNQLRTYRSASHLSFEAAQPRTTCGAQAREDVQCSAHL